MTAAIPAITPRPCHFYDDRPAGETISLLVIHNISLPAGQFADDPAQHAYIDDLFCGVLNTCAAPGLTDLKGLRVSAHCVIWRDGRIFQYVPFAKRAWHAGVSQFAGKTNCNDFAIGIELEGTDHLPYTEQQYNSLIALTRYIMQQYPAITADRITGHCDIAPGRKTDPGPAFNWTRYKTAIKEFTV